MWRVTHGLLKSLTESDTHCFCRISLASVVASEGGESAVLSQAGPERGEQEIFGVSRSSERREMDILATQENDSVWIGHSENVYS